MIFAGKLSELRLLDDEHGEHFQDDRRGEGDSYERRQLAEPGVRRKR